MPTAFGLALRRNAARPRRGAQSAGYISFLRRIFTSAPKGCAGRHLTSQGGQSRRSCTNFGVLTNRTMLAFNQPRAPVSQTPGLGG